jgi:Tfp pilus assembly protein PilN
MKKINLIGWLSRNSHEKQKPQRFARYAAMLIMLLTLGVGQMWGV